MFVNLHRRKGVPIAKSLNYAESLRATPDSDLQKEDITKLPFRGKTHAAKTGSKTSPPLLLLKATS